MAVVRNISTNDLYLWLGDTKFRNLRTGVEGEVSEEKAQEVFKINLEATFFVTEFPIVEDLIKTFNLKIDKP